MSRTFACCLLWLMVCPPALAQRPKKQTGEMIVREAVRQQFLNKPQAEWPALGDISMTAKYKVTNGKDNFEGMLTQLYRGPDKLALRNQVPAKPPKLSVFDGAKGSFMRLGRDGKGKVFPMEKKDLQDIQQVLARARLLLLRNLLVDGAGFVRTSRRARRVRVELPGQEPMVLTFNSEYLLQQAVCGRALDQQIVFGGYRLFDGLIRLPTLVTVNELVKDKEGKRWAPRVRIELRRVELRKKLRAGIFVDPRRVAEYLANR